MDPFHAAAAAAGASKVRLFGVTISPAIPAMPPEAEEVMRKCKSMGNLAVAAAGGSGVPVASGVGSGYASDDDLHRPSRRRRAAERKKAVPWTEEEHRTFLAGLEKLGKGDWRGISKNFVPTRTPTQVASHAQKYFLRQTNSGRRKRRSSLFDMMIGDQASSGNASASHFLSAGEQNVLDQQDFLYQSNMKIHSPVSPISTSHTSEAVPITTVLPTQIATGYLGELPQFNANNIMKTLYSSPFDQSLASSPSAAERETKASPYPLPTATSSCNTASLLRLMDVPSAPAQATSVFHLAEAKGLELSIAPPSPRPKMPPENAVGTISVV